MPTAARTSARAANSPTRRSRNRRSASQPPISSAKVENLTGTSGAISWKIARAVGTISPTGAALPVIHVDDRTRGKIQTAPPNVANDADDSLRLQVAVHVAEIYHLTDGVL